MKTTTSQSKQISQQKSQLDDLSKQLKDKQDQLDAANTKAKGTQDQLDEVTQEKQALSNCLNAIVAAGEATTQAEYDKLVQTVNTACDAAEKYLN